jgi:protein-disulfide isomerase
MRRALAALALLTLGAAKPADWSKTVTTTRTGAHVIGNPSARTKLAEYMSYTCGHCAHFAAESPAMVRDYVAKGLIAFEIRNAVRDRLDFAAALAARCGGPARFYGNHSAIFAAQEAIFAKVQAWEAAGRAKSADPDAGLKEIARGSGLTDLMAKRGIAPAALDACLVSKPSQAAVIAMTNDAWQVRKIKGTPSFLVNDKPIAANDWAGVEPALRSTLGMKPKG